MLYGLLLFYKGFSSTLTVHVENQRVTLVGGEIATVAACGAGGGSFLCCKCVILYQSTAGAHMMMSNRYALILQPLSCSDSSVNYLNM